MLDEKRRAGDARLEAIEQKVADVDVKVASIEERLGDNAELIRDIHADMKLTQEIHEWVGNAKGFFRILGAVGAVLKWMAGVAAAILALWVLLRGHGK